MAPKSKAEKAAAKAAKDVEQQAPKQETLEAKPLAAASSTAAGYGSTPEPEAAPPAAEHKGWAHHAVNFKFPTPEEMDARMPKKMRDICNNWIVGTHQFDEMENASGALTCARILRAFLIFFIFTSTIGLCVGFFFKASLAAPMETEQYADLNAPSVVFCASPWGTDFLGFEVLAVRQGMIPGNTFEEIPSANWTLQAFNSTLGEQSASLLTGCKVLELKDVFMQAQGKVGSYTAFETIRLSVNAQSEDGKFNYGFANADNLLPQRWNYGALGSRISGEIQYDQVNVGATDVSEGVPRSVLYFKPTGTVSLGKKTEIEYFFGYFMLRVLSAQSKGLSVFAVVAFILLLAAAVNNCGLFELFFVEYVADDEEPPALVPNMVCQAICGQAFSSCRRRKQDPAEEEGAEEAPATA